MNPTDLLTLLKDLGVPQFVMLVFFILVVWRTGMFKKNGNGNGTHEVYPTIEAITDSVSERLEVNHFQHISRDIQGAIRDGFREMRDDHREFLKEFRDQERAHHDTVEKKIDEFKQTKCNQ